MSNKDSKVTQWENAQAVGLLVDIQTSLRDYYEYVAYIRIKKEEGQEISREEQFLLLIEDKEIQAHDIDLIRLIHKGLKPVYRSWKHGRWIKKVYKKLSKEELDLLLDMELYS